MSPFKIMYKFGLKEIREELYDYIERTGNKDAWQALVQFGDGTYGLRTGYLDLKLGFYDIPNFKKPEELDRLYNRDLDDMDYIALTHELISLADANVVYGSLRQDGLRDIVICKERGAYTWSEWLELRRKAIHEKLEKI